MLLKSISLTNFRQFIGEQFVEFATNTNKNVTVVLAENGTGKTTLAQAFSWVMYGQTDFKVKDIINAKLVQALKAGEEAIARVELNLVHNDIDYTIMREQVYKKEFKSVRPMSSNLKISFSKDGKQKFADLKENDIIIKNILPVELSKYFFFDGERIEKMGKEIDAGKCHEFAEAVRGLLGLNALAKTLEHLKPTSKYSVIGKYNSMLDSSGDEKIAKCGADIAKKQNQVESIVKRLDEIDTQISYFKNIEMTLTKEIEEYAETEKLQRKSQALVTSIKGLEVRKVEIQRKLFSLLNKRGAQFFTKSMSKEALEILKTSDKIDKGIPNMHAKSIEYLLKRGYCVCGTKIEDGNDAYKHLLDAIKYLPPQSIGVEIKSFVNQINTATKSSEDFYNNFLDEFKSIRIIKKEITEKQNELRIVDGKIINTKNIGVKKQEQLNAHNVIKKLDIESKELYEKKGAISTEINRLEKEKANLALIDEKNRKVEKYKQYAIRIYDEINKVYTEQEAITRSELEQAINGIFKSIYEGGMSIKMDDKYRVDVSIDEFDNDTSTLEKSTAQSISVIFAFIAGIIDMARKRSKPAYSDNDTENLLIAEPYPLVMDAPLSAFDKRRIKNVCSVLPKIAEQVIIFIKDTDGEIAEKYLGDLIGKKYAMNKNSETETRIVER